jgi:hypothetical protein
VAVAALLAAVEVTAASVISASNVWAASVASASAVASSSAGEISSSARAVAVVTINCSNASTVSCCSLLAAVQAGNSQSSKPQSNSKRSLFLISIYVPSFLHDNSSHEQH